MFEHSFNYCSLEYVQITDQNHMTMYQQASRNMHLCLIYLAIPASKHNDIFLKCWVSVFY